MPLCQLSAPLLINTAHDIWEQHRVTDVLTSKHADCDSISLLFLINPCSQILFSPSCLHGQVRGQGHNVVMDIRGLYYLPQTQELNLGSSSWKVFQDQACSLSVFTCSDFTFPWMLSWDAPRASLASDESETKTESCDKALLPRLIFDLWETGRGRNRQSRKWCFTASTTK